MAGSSRVHRSLRLGSPHAKGADVATLQRALNKRLHARGRDSIKADGDFGKATANAVRTVLYLLGCPQQDLERGATQTFQRIIRRPGLRPPSWLKRAADRKRIEAKKHTRAKATVDWCVSKKGVTEHPPSSNRGPEVSKWQREFGIDGQPWCGAFVGYALRHVAGIPVPAGIVYTPNILAWAKNHQYGFSFHSTPQVGDLALFDFIPGGEPVMHVGIVVRSDGTTCEGNTSPTEAGSQDNGGSVAVKRRPSSQLVGYARPSYGD